MTKGVLIVESRPASPDDAAAFHRCYEITGDVEAAKGNLAAALKSGSMSRPVAVQLDPPPTMQYLRDIGEHGS